MFSKQTNLSQQKEIDNANKKTAASTNTLAVHDRRQRLDSFFFVF